MMVILSDEIDNGKGHGIGKSCYEIVIIVIIIVSRVCHSRPSHIKVIFASLQSTRSPPSINFKLVRSVQCTVLREVASLCREVRYIRQTRDPPKQKFKLPVSRTRSVLRNLMSSQRSLHKRQSTLGVRASIYTSTSYISVGVEIQINLTGCFLNDLVERGVIRDIEVARLRRFLEPLLAAPGHVLDRDEGAVGNEQEVKHSVGDDDILGAVDD